MPKQSPSQTVGPFFHDALIEGNEHILVNEQAVGVKIVLTGCVLDGEGVPIPDAMVEIWQADANGHFNHPNDPNRTKADPNFRGFGRSPTREDGRFTFHTIKPGIVAEQTVPFISLRLFARGMLIHAVTRIYFAEQPGNAHDPVFRTVPSKRQGTLLAKLEMESGVPTYRFDIHLQGAQETVFFDA